MKNFKLIKFSLQWFLFGALAILSCGCDNDDNNGDNVNPAETLTFTFEQSAEGWEGGVADFPKDWDRSRLEFEFENEELPAGVGETGKSLKISGRNISDDLFMFMKKQVTGLEPNHSYAVTFEIELASSYPEQSVGIGGSPGASVFLKAGGASIEPMPVEQDDNIRMNIDKGGQSRGGENMLVLGNVGIPGDEFEYRLIQRNNLQEPIEITSDNDGSLWLIIGTDSGFEGTTTLYYSTVEITLAY
ncbi:hypothetical protein [uncultured Pontibacter sp.]|uniref:hypothetical protein n=1 Tax=uncultured Pontibacter sp. TaxID=453356 RepID=UPI002611DFAE|nr:hypothetical protein [uncultured Pontibacter sp.]